MTEENQLNDDDMSTTDPTEAGDDKDTGTHGAKDTGDEPTERDDDKDAGGEGEKDTGDDS